MIHIHKGGRSRNGTGFSSAAFAEWRDEKKQIIWPAGRGNTQKEGGRRHWPRDFLLPDSGPETLHNVFAAKSKDHPQMDGFINLELTIGVYSAEDQEMSGQVSLHLWNKDR